jgi:hypothetical protein
MSMTQVDEVAQSLGRLRDYCTALSQTERNVIQAAGNGQALAYVKFQRHS